MENLPPQLGHHQQAPAVQPLVEKFQQPHFAAAPVVDSDVALLAAALEGGVRANAKKLTDDWRSVGGLKYLMECCGFHVRDEMTIDLS